MIRDQTCVKRDEKTRQGMESGWVLLVGWLFVCLFGLAAQSIASLWESRV